MECKFSKNLKFSQKEECKEEKKRDSKKDCKKECKKDSKDSKCKNEHYGEQVKKMPKFPIIYIFFTNSLCLEGNFFSERLLKIFNKEVEIIPAPTWLHFKNICKDTKINMDMSIKILFNFTTEDILKFKFGKIEILYLAYNFISSENLGILKNSYRGQKFTKNLQLEVVLDESLTYQVFREKELSNLVPQETFSFNPFENLNDKGENLLIFPEIYSDENLNLLTKRFLLDKFKSYLQDYYKNGKKIGLLGRGVDIIINLQDLYEEAELIYKIFRVKNVFIDTPFYQRENLLEEIEIFR